MAQRIRKAFVMGAGLGTRLRPLTDAAPKPLVPIFHQPLITFALDHLLAAGVESFVINTHHLADQFEETFAGGSYRGAPVTLIFEPDLLETGGGIKNAQPFLDGEPFLVYSGDLLTDIDVVRLIDEHFACENDVTLALRQTGFSPSIALQDGRIIDIRGKYGHPGQYDFANLSVWNPSIFDRIPPAQKISFVPIVHEWIGQGGRIGGVVLDDFEWFNIGSRKEYLEVHRTIAEGRWSPAYGEPRWEQAIHPDAVIAEDAVLEGFNAIGPGAEVGTGAYLKDCVIWPGAKIASRASLTGCIVRNGRIAEGTLRDADI